MRERPVPPRSLTTRLKELGAEEEQLQRELAELPERTRATAGAASIAD
ncbi:hypothetical protein [Sphingobium chungangianum]